MTIRSYKDASYNAAKAGDSVAESAKFINDNCPTFLDGAPEEVMSEVVDGILLRYSERHPAQTYLRVDGNLVLCKGKVPEKGEKLEVSIFSAMSYSQQQHGQMKNTDPMLYAVHGKLRTDFNKYKSNVLGSIRKAIKQLIDPTDRTRAAMADFAVWIVSEFETIKTRCKNAKARGDATADSALLDRQIKAFFAVK